MAVENPFIDDLWASVYDAGAQIADDVPLYLALAAERPGRVLELGCGTGRVLLPLARAGHPVTGVDSAPAMLALARRKLSRESEAVRARVRLVEGDMRDLRLDERYDLALLAANSIILLDGADEQRRLVAGVREHLAPGGRFVVDVFVPDPRVVAQPPGALTQDRTYPWTERDATVRERAVVLASDPATQTREEERRFEVTWRDGITVAHTIRWRMRLVYPQELLYLFELARLRIAATYGGWSGEPFGRGSERIIVVGERT